MKKMLVTALMFSAIPIVGMADVREVAREGAWSMHAGMTELRRPVCAIATQGPGGRAFIFQYVGGDRNATVRLYAPRWNFPEGTSMPIRIMGEQGQMVLMGLSERNGIRVPLPNGGTGRLEDLLRGTSPILVDAPLAESSTWILPTNGADEMTNKLTECIEAMPARPNQPNSNERLPSGPSLRT